jgi:hypothetical protein
MASNQWASACGRAHACLPACAEASWLQCFAPGNKPCRADSPAGWLLQGDRDPEGARHRLWICGRQACKRNVPVHIHHLRRRFAGRPAPTRAAASCLCRRQACKRFVPVHIHHLRRGFAGRPAPTNTKTRFFPCRSLPASESCGATGVTSGDDSPAGRLLQGQPHLVFVGDKPASESCRSTSITSGDDSPAGQLLQGKEERKRFVPGNGHCLRRRFASRLAPTGERRAQAICTGPHPSPQATIRRQAGSYKGSRILSL